MNDEQALLAAIQSHPDEDAPRLAYADWLDEHARSEADRARAEFIRTQIESARLPADDDYRAELEARAEKLLHAHQRDWLPPDPVWLALFYKWQRGFVAALDPCSRGVFNGENHLKDLAAFPLAEELNLSFYVADAEFRHMPDLPNLRSLDIGGNARITADSVRRIGRWRTLRRLSLTGDTITDAALPHLAQLNGLEELDLSYTRITDEGLQHLAPLTALRALNLSRTALTARGLRTVAALPRLRKLILRDMPLGAAELNELTRMPALEELDLWDDFPNRQLDAAFLAPLEDVPALHSLALNGWGDPSWTVPERLLSLRRLRGLEELKTWDLELGNDGLAAVCELPRLARLHYAGHLVTGGLHVLAGVPGLLALKLDCTGITDNEFTCLGVLQSLRWLDLSNSPITDAGLKYLEALPALLTLILDHTSISDSGLHAIKLPSLRRFSARGTSVTQDGAWNRRAAWAPGLRDACGEGWSVGSPSWARGERSW
ncbi:TIGR02996 domain-containing protein [Gemmata sp. JC673]|uniref:TIGR02996 domain-containing protein n=1 Tax=Gemmata algarum TaxID=2975278 RepID=A0ABU5ERB8_9BACT|nr:TIGR02996 domain-containing protein [Gemmata algarum]MDY3557770.1 TIGR02996 domain-containing protein [Gemmata algarum]